ncbi:MAG: hypothetical protein H0T47_22845 [Planctomycetaceae bacterium]|nr:hypothetical protein [Planctomycetaceae bacterium]
MTRDKTLRWQTAWAVPLLAALCYAAGVKAAEPDVARIRKDWQERFTATKDFVYKTEGRMISPKGTMIIAGDETAPESIRETGYPLKDITRPYGPNLYVDLQADLLRVETREYVFNVETLESREQRLFEAYDGETLWTGRADGDGGIALQPASRAEWFFVPSDLPFFFAHGIFPLKSLNYQNLAEQTAESLTITSEGTSIVSGRPCTIVRVQRSNARDDVRHLLYVEPLRQSAILRYEKHYNFKPLFRKPGIDYPTGTVLGMSMDVEYQEVDDLWVPERLIKNVYNVMNARIVNGQVQADLTETIELEVTEVAVNQGIDRSLFAQPLSPGMIVRDDRDDGKKYKVADDKRTLVPLPRSGGGERTTSLPYWLAIGGVGCLLLYAGIVLFRRSV